MTYVNHFDRTDNLTVHFYALPYHYIWEQVSGLYEYRTAGVTGACLFKHKCGQIGEYAFSSMRIKRRWRKNLMIVGCGVEYPLNTTTILMTRGPLNTSMGAILTLRDVMFSRRGKLSDDERHASKRRRWSHVIPRVTQSRATTCTLLV